MIELFTFINTLFSGDSSYSEQLPNSGPDFITIIYKGFNTHTCIQNSKYARVHSKSSTNLELHHNRNIWISSIQGDQTF